jgi:hypothetical protein
MPEIVLWHFFCIKNFLQEKNKMTMILSLIPQELWILVLLGAAFAVIFGIISRGAIVGIIVTMVIFAIVGPIFWSWFDSLPAWVSTLLTIIFVLTTISWIITLLFGKRTGSHFMALILHDIVLAPFRVMRFMFRRR